MYTVQVGEIKICRDPRTGARCSTAPPGYPFLPVADTNEWRERYSTSVSLIRKCGMRKNYRWLHRTIRKFLVRIVLFPEKEDELSGKVEETRHNSKLCIGVLSMGRVDILFDFCIVCLIFQIPIFGLLGHSLSNPQNLSGLLGLLQTVQKQDPSQVIQTQGPVSRPPRASTPSLRPF